MTSTTAPPPQPAPAPSDPLPAPSAPSEPSTSPTDASTALTSPTDPPLSKNAQKRLLRQQRFAATRSEWKAKKRALEKARKARKRQDRAAGAAAANHEPPVKKVTKDVTIVIDCGFDSYMTEREVVSMSAQLTRSYAVNKGARVSGRLAVSGLDGRLQERYEGVLKGQHRKWKGVEFLECGYGGERKEDVVYLTADSEETVMELEEGKRYVVGGIVDRNRYKGLCYEKAVKGGVKTAKLPIGEYIKLASRQVLTTNQVVEIMVCWLETRDWRESFLRVIPKRKGVEDMGDGDCADEGEGGEDMENANTMDEDDDMEVDEAEQKESSAPAVGCETTKPPVEEKVKVEA